MTTYPADGITYRASSMQIAAHSDVGFNNESKGRSCNRAHIFLSKDDAKPRWNGTLLVLTAIMKPVFASAAEAELAALYKCARAMVTLW